LWLARSRASHYVTLKNFVRVVTEIVDFTSETVVAMTIMQYLCPRFLQSRSRLWLRNVEKCGKYSLANFVYFCIPISARNTKVYKMCELCKAIFSAFYNISQPNFAILLIKNQSIMGIQLSIIKHRKQAGLFYITIVVTDIALTANMGAFPPQFHTQCKGSSICLRTVEGSCSQEKLITFKPDTRIYL
jgi:hypothetical protein